MGDVATVLIDEQELSCTDAPREEKYIYVVHYLPVNTSRPQKCG